jgi:hypothetical protein
MKTTGQIDADLLLLDFRMFAVFLLPGTKL